MCWIEEEMRVALGASVSAKLDQVLRMVEKKSRVLAGK